MKTKLHDVNAGGRAFSYAYGGTGFANPVPDSLVRPNGNITSYTYDNIFRLKDIKNLKSDGVTVLTENAFVYDKAHMKTQETVTSNALPKAGMEAVTYTNNNVNQLVSSTGPARNYVYDADGNMTKGYTPDGLPFTAVYDAENRMTNISYNGADGTIHRASFAYGPEGFVAKQVVDGVETRFVRDGYYCLQERNGANSVTRAYVWDHVSPGGIGGLLEMTKNGKRYNYYYDGKGNVSACINADPALSQTDGEYAYYAYDSVGGQVSQAGTLEQPYRFSTKYYYAGYGLNDYGYRFYNPMVGKWMTRDPIGEDGGLNLYGAMDNSLINEVDAFGLYSLEEALLNYFTIGKDIELNLSEIDSNYTPMDFDGFRGELMSVYRQETTKDISLSQGDNKYGFAGHVIFDLNGKIKSDCNKWNFKGKVTARPDTFDFNPGNREELEWAIQFMHYAFENRFSNEVIKKSMNGMWPTGKPFRITFKGSRTVEAQGQWDNFKQ